MRARFRFRVTFGRSDRQTLSRRINALRASQDLMPHARVTLRASRPGTGHFTLSPALRHHAMLR